MTLRCKKGDMAIVLYSIRGNEGKIVDVVRFVGEPNWPSDELDGMDYWAISHRGETHNPDGEQWIARDCDLMPIRPGDLQETEETEKDLEMAK
jgi:hypothetical protein